MPQPIDYECIVQEIYEYLLRPGDVAIDVGAHLGRHTFPLAEAVAPTGKVIALEPLPACREQLHHQLRDHSRLFLIVEMLPFALSDRAGMASFLIPEAHPAFGGLRE